MNGKELVAFARSKMGTPYVYGMKGTIMTEANYSYLKKVYGDLVWDTDEKKIGKVCVDCSGLISWATGKYYGSGQLYERAIKRESITTIKNAPVGALVWKQGHVGIYTGMRNNEPYYIAADGSAFGVREVPCSKNQFTHWLLIDYVTYDPVVDVTITKEEDEEMIQKSKIIVNNKEVIVELIFKDGTNYVKLRDFADALGLKVSTKDNVPVIDTK